MKNPCKTCLYYKATLRGAKEGYCMLDREDKVYLLRGEGDSCPKHTKEEKL